jgi:hypothetical protein
MCLGNMLSAISVTESACIYFMTKKGNEYVIMQCMLMLLALKLEVK